MPRFVALLRGINVGSANRVPMADLRTRIEALGCTRVRTLLNSGNVVFDARAGTAGKHAARIQAAVLEGCGVRANVLVLVAADFTAALAEDALGRIASDPSRHLLAFTQEPNALAPLAAVAKSEWKPEAFAIGERAAYLWCVPNVHESRLGKAVYRALGDAVTMRNRATADKIAALLAAGGD